MSSFARIVVVSLLLLAPYALACSCINTGDPLKDVANHEAVFLGKVIASELVPMRKDGGPYAPRGTGQLKGSFRLYRITVLQVTERWTGEVAPFVILATGSGGGDCGYSFEAGKSYLVYADRTKDTTLTKLAGATPALTTSLCTFNSPVDDAADAIASIRAKYRSQQPVFMK